MFLFTGGIICKTKLLFYGQKSELWEILLFIHTREAPWFAGKHGSKYNWVDMQTQWQGWTSAGVLWKLTGQSVRFLSQVTKGCSVCSWHLHYARVNIFSTPLHKLLLLSVHEAPNCMKLLTSISYMPVRMTSHRVHDQCTQVFQLHFFFFCKC